MPNLSDSADNSVNRSAARSANRREIFSSESKRSFDAGKSVPQADAAVDKEGKPQRQKPADEGFKSKDETSAAGTDSKVPTSSQDDKPVEEFPSSLDKSVDEGPL